MIPEAEIFFRKIADHGNVFLDVAVLMSVYILAFFMYKL